MSNDAPDPLSEDLRRFIDEAPHVRRPHVDFLRGVGENLSPGATVLDVGSGDAPYRELFTGLHYLTNDWAGTEHAPENPVDIVSPADAIPLDDQSVDGLVCTQVLEHLAEPGQALDEFFRLLKPGGSLWLTAPLTWYLHETPFDFYRYTPWGLRYLLERSGFTDIDIQPMNDSMGTVAELLRHLRWIIGPANDELDDRRAAVGDLLAHLADTVESVGYLDSQRLLPISFSARAIRPAESPLGQTSAAVGGSPATPSATASPAAPGASSAAAPEAGEYDVSVVVTAHREGTLAHHTVKSLVRAVGAAREHGLSVEVVCALDRADEATRAYFAEVAGPEGQLAGSCPVTVIEVDHGDPSLARNSAIERTRGTYVTIVDADNLLSQNWLHEAVTTLRERGPNTVVHPEYLVTFEGQHVIWPQLSSDDPEFRPDAFYSFNYWDTICAASRDLFTQHPYSRSGAAFGPEDWHWNTMTLTAGAIHLAVSDTALFYRVKRAGSRNNQLLPEGRPLDRTPLLISPELAALEGVAPQNDTDPEPPTNLTPSLERVLAESRDEAGTAGIAGQLTSRPAEATGEAPRRRRKHRDSPVDPHQYRALYDDLRHLSDEQLLDHFKAYGRAEGRIPRLTEEDLERLQAAHFIASHYQLLNPDLGGSTEAELVRHYLAQAELEGRRARLHDSELRQLAAFDVDDYRALHPDLASLSDDEAVAHYIQSGLSEGRRARLTPAERVRRSGGLPQSLLDEWTTAHAIDPLVPIPTESVVAGYQWYLPPPHGDLRNTVWWRLVSALPERVDFMFFAPWIRMGGGDAVLARYAKFVSERRPHERVVMFTTEAESTRKEWLPEQVQLVELPLVDGYAELSRTEQIRMVASLVVQYAPSAVHIINSPVAMDAVEQHSAAMSERSKLFLSTFAVDRTPSGELFNWMFRRHSRFLDDVSAVIVDNAALVDQFWELYRYPREKFVVHHHPVALPQIRDRPSRAPQDTLDVLWAARFDRQKRPDVLAEIVDACRRRGLPVRFHVYGASVMGEGGEYEDALNRMRREGVEFHPPYASFAELPPERYGLFLMTSEWEGTPLTLLDAIAHGLPILAPAVGGIAEVVDETTGYLVSRFDDVDAYVHHIATIVADPTGTDQRARRGIARLAADHSWSVWEAEVAATAGYLGSSHPQ